MIVLASLLSVSDIKIVFSFRFYVHDFNDLVWEIAVSRVNKG